VFLLIFGSLDQAGVNEEKSHNQSISANLITGFVSRENNVITMLHGKLKGKLNEHPDEIYIGLDHTFHKLS
jgi:hypothetical protein